MNIDTFLSLQDITKVELGVRMGYPPASAGQSVNQALRSGGSLVFVDRFNKSFPSFHMIIAKGGYAISGVGVEPAHVSMGLDELCRLVLLSPLIYEFVKRLERGLLVVGFLSQAKDIIYIKKSDMTLVAMFPAVDMPFVVSRLQE